MKNTDQFLTADDYGNEVFVQDGSEEYGVSTSTDADEDYFADASTPTSEGNYDPSGKWIDNGDGTFTATPGATLYGLYGADWQQESGFTGDPTTLQVGQTVGEETSQPVEEISIQPSADDDSVPSPTATPIPDASSTEYTVLVGAEIIGLGAIALKGAQELLLQTMKAVTAGTATAGTIAASTISTGGCILVGGAVIFIGVDLITGDGLDVSKTIVRGLVGGN